MDKIYSDANACKTDWKIEQQHRKIENDANCNEIEVHP